MSSTSSSFGAPAGGPSAAPPPWPAAHTVPRPGLRLEVTVRRNGLHLVVTGVLDARAQPRVDRALHLLERSPRGGTVDLSGVEAVDPDGLRPWWEGRGAAGARIVVTAVSPAVAAAARTAGLPDATPFRLASWTTG